ncbi:hypothetical protein HYU50_01875 [Candidatus Woesearchaeota archaeon]|nr:hypothetical protein [Candidatus Woesearchaeota archaeon]
MNLKSKRGQATIFVIIGLVILITAFTIFFAQKAAVQKPVEKQAEKQPQFAGQAELKNYVDICLQSAVLQGLEIMRQQSGYIDIPPDSSILEAEGSKMPYWLTPDKVAIPSLDFMEKELENYVAKELKLCTNDFKDFRNQGFKVNYSNIKTNADMEKAVVVNVELPIILEKEGIKFEEKNFVYTVPIDMQLIQKTASDLAALEDFHAYLEEHAKNLISLYSGVEQNRLPPFSQSTTNFDCSFVSWDKQDVKSRLKNILQLNMPNLKVEGTRFTQPQSNQQFKAVYDSFVYDLFNEEFPNLKVDFIYKNDWEFLDYDIIPNNGNLLTPDKVVGTNIPMLPQICVFKYPFKYTMQYPVLVEITDLDSAKIDPAANAYYESKGFTFQFPMVAYLCGNQNRQCNTGNLPVVDVTSFAVANITLLPETLFCNQEQRISNEMTIRTFDSLNTNALANVDVNYYCGSYQNDCFIGRTDSNGILKTRFPLCINGQIYFTKDSYSVLSQNLSTYELPESEFAYFLEPKNNLKVEARKIDIRSLVENYFENKALSIENSVVDLANGEKVTIVSDTGLFYIYPDPADRPLQIGTGNHGFDLQLTAENASLLGFLSIDSFVSNENLKKSKVAFYVFEDDSVDSILRADGNLEAELLYSCQKNADNSCNFGNCSLADIDGTNIQDFRNDSETCKEAFNVTIAKEQYQDLVRPIFS